MTSGIEIYFGIKPNEKLQCINDEKKSLKLQAYEAYVESHKSQVIERKNKK